MADAPPPPPAAGAANVRVKTVALPVSGVKLSFAVDWDVGIGGDIWVGGSMLCGEIDSRIDYFRALMQGKRVLELGSGTGLVGLAAAATCEPAEMWLTDLDSHVEIMRTNAARNSTACAAACDVRVEAYDWAASAAHLQPPFDCILGTDLAYNPVLYRPVVAALKANSHAGTVTLLGVTRSDTGREFFELLEAEGFEYYKVPDTEVAGKFDGSAANFGLFVIFLRR